MITEESTTEANEMFSLAQRRAFMKLPLEERRRQLAEQADRMAEHYESDSERTERAQWQCGDIVES